jgi:Superinfection immunity protein
MHFLIFGGALYFLPAIIAAARHTHNATGILLLNLFLGWTMVGWFVALVMAFSSLPAYAYGWYHHRGW